MNQTFQRWVICVFSYNRAALLQNLLASIQQFYPDMNYAIFDDNSNEVETIQLLEQERRKGKHVYVHSAKSLESKHGALYELMNCALQYGIQQNYRYAYFVQDDMQFLWRDEKLQERVEDVFSMEECVMCNFSFLQKILKGRIENRMVPISGRSYFSFLGNGIVDTGVIDLAKAKEAGLFFPKQSESCNGKYWYEKGYRLYWLPVTHLAWTPWPVSFRHKKKESGQVHVLHPLSDKNIQRISVNSGYAYLEDYTSTQKRMFKPYWFSANPGRINLWKIYIKYFLGIPLAK